MEKTKENQWIKDTLMKEAPSDFTDQLMRKVEIDKLDYKPIIPAYIGKVILATFTGVFILVFFQTSRMDVLDKVGLDKIYIDIENFIFICLLVFVLLALKILNVMYIRKRGIFS